MTNLTKRNKVQTQYRYCWHEGLDYNTKDLKWNGKDWVGDMGKLPPFELCMKCHIKAHYEHPTEEICGKCIVCLGYTDKVKVQFD